jgi:hypothetical protein
MLTPIAHQYGLGPLPWSDETLVAAVWRDFQSAKKQVNEHPGQDLYERAESLKSVLRIFNTAAERFFASLERFHAEAHDGNLFRRNRQADLHAFESGFQETLYVYASSAMTLVDQARALSERISVPGYDERVRTIFSEKPRHRFIQELRNDLIHVTLHQPGWQIATNHRHETSSRFMLWPDQLTRTNKYHALARSYVRAHPKGIDMGKLLKSYSADVNAFQSWLHEGMEVVAGEQIADYRRCLKRINAVSSNSWWNIILKQVVLAYKRDPYEYLDQYLTADELAEVNGFPFRSREQVDRIIALVDEYGACNDELRRVVYQAFGVTPACN